MKWSRLIAFQLNHKVAALKVLRDMLVQLLNDLVDGLFPRWFRISAFFEGTEKLLQRLFNNIGQWIGRLKFIEIIYEHEIQLKQQ